MKTKSKSVYKLRKSLREQQDLIRTLTDERNQIIDLLELRPFSGSIVSNIEKLSTRLDKHIEAMRWCDLNSSVTITRLRDRWILIVRNEFPDGKNEVRLYENPQLAHAIYQAFKDECPASQPIA